VKPADSAASGRRRAWITWSLWLALTVLAAAGLSRHRIDNDLADWMPDLVPAGPRATWVVVGLPRGVGDPPALAAGLRNRPEVAAVYDPATVTAASRFGGPSPDGLTGRPGDAMTATWVFAADGVPDADLVRAVESVLAECGTPVPPVASTPMVDAADAADASGDKARGPHLAGPAVFRVAMNQWSQRGLDGISGLQVGLVFAALLLITGRVTVALAGAVTIAGTQLMLLGVFAWHETPLDLALSLVPPLIAALGASVVLHRALRRGSGRAVAASSLTTMAGILVFAVGGLLPLLRFATWGATGVGLVALAAWMLVPPPPRGRRARDWRRRIAARLHRGLTLIAPRGPRTAAAAGLIIIVAAGMLAVRPGLQFETDPLRSLPAGARVRHDFEAIDGAVAGMLPFEVTVADAGAGTGAESFDPTPLLMRTAGVRRLIPAPGEPGRWWGLASNDAGPAFAAAMPGWRAAAGAAGVELQIRGVAPTLAAVGTTVRRLAAISIPTMILVATIAGGIVGRGIRAAAAAALVNAVPVAILGLVAVIGRIELGLPALMVAAIATGAGIDDTVHLLAAAREHGPRRARARCLPACLGSSLVAAASLCLFGLSPFGPVRQFGGLMAVTLIAAVVADLMLLPALLARSAGPSAD
jgi:hypothetical protein